MTRRSTPSRRIEPVHPEQLRPISYLAKEHTKKLDTHSINKGCLIRRADIRSPDCGALFGTSIFCHYCPVLYGCRNWPPAGRFRHRYVHHARVRIASKQGGAASDDRCGDERQAGAGLAGGHRRWPSCCICGLASLDSTCPCAHGHVAAADELADQFFYRQDARAPYRAVRGHGGLVVLGVLWFVPRLPAIRRWHSFPFLRPKPLVGLFLIAKVPVIARGSLSCLNFPGMLKLLKMTLPIAAATIAGITYGRMDVFFLEKFRSAEELGLYAFAVRLVEPFQFIAGALAVNAYGHIAHIVENVGGSGIGGECPLPQSHGPLYAGLALLTVLVLANVLLLYTFKQYAAGQAMLNT